MPKASRVAVAFFTTLSEFIAVKVLSRRWFCAYPNIFGGPMGRLSSRDAELERARARAAALTGTIGGERFAAEVSLTARAEELPPMDEGAAPSDPTASTMTALLKHGGLYTLLDRGMMAARLQGMTGVAKLEPTMAMADLEAIPTYFFYNIVDAPYALHSRLISYLVYPNRHLGSPVVAGTADDKPESGEGKTFAYGNTPSHDIPAAFTFVGQFLDHDLTLNGLNLLGRGMKPANPDSNSIVDQASPFVDLDSVYGPRIDDLHPAKERDVPVKDGYFRLRAIQGGGYDVPRTKDFVALIGDKRNDENQLILQIHILVMRLHNAIRATHPQGGNGKNAFDFAKEQTVLHWQSLVANEYLGLVAGADIRDGVLGRLASNLELVYHPVQLDDDAKPRLRMAHEFAIGFRYGHSQLRSAYALNPGNVFRLFDSLSDGSHDLQGGKCLTNDRVIDWEFFLARAIDGRVLHPSNLIDTEVNRVVFDLPETAIPDDVKLVSNLPFRNLVRSNDLELCAGEDLAARYAAIYHTVTVLTQEQVEPDQAHRDLFRLDGGTFRTPLWYYILREAEVARSGHNSGRLGPMGAHLVSEVLLSGIWEAPTSFLKNRPAMAWISHAAEQRGYATLHDIAEFVSSVEVKTPGTLDDPCPAA